MTHSKISLDVLQTIRYLILDFKEQQCDAFTGLRTVHQSANLGRNQEMNPSPHSHRAIFLGKYKLDVANLQYRLCAWHEAEWGGGRQQESRARREHIAGSRK